MLCPCRRLTRSLRMDSLSQQSQRQACVRLSLKPMLSCKLTLLVQIVCFENTALNNENDTTFVLQASPYDTRKLANPKDVMPYLPEACGDICQVMSPWPGCGKPANEAERLAATEKLQLIGKEPHPALQRYVDLISTCYQVLPPGPVCLQACCHHKRPRLASLLCTTSSLNSVTALQSIHNHHVTIVHPSWHYTHQGCILCPCNHTACPNCSSTPKLQTAHAILPDSCGIQHKVSSHKNPTAVSAAPTGVAFPL